MISDAHAFKRLSILLQQSLKRFHNPSFIFLSWIKEQAPTMSILYSGLFSWVEIFVKSSIRPPELNFVVLNFVARWSVIWTLTLNTCAIDVALRQRIMRERSYYVHEAIWEASQRENRSVLIRLLWLLPFVVNERGNSLAFCSCLRLLQIACSLLRESTQLTRRTLWIWGTVNRVQ